MARIYTYGSGREDYSDYTYALATYSNFIVCRDLIFASYSLADALLFNRGERKRLEKREEGSREFTILKQAGNF